MLAAGDARELDVGEAEPRGLGHQPVRKRPVSEGAAIRRAAPRPGAGLEDGDRLPQPVAVAAGVHPLVVLPCMGPIITDHRDAGAGRRQLPGERVRALGPGPASCAQREAITSTGEQTRDE